MVFGSPEANELAERTRCIERAMPCRCELQPIWAKADGEYLLFCSDSDLFPSQYGIMTPPRKTPTAALYDWNRSIEHQDGYHLAYCVVETDVDAFIEEMQP